MIIFGIGFAIVGLLLNVIDLKKKENIDEAIVIDLPHNN